MRIDIIKRLLSSNAVKIGLLLLFLFQLVKINYHVLGVDAGAILPASRDVVKYGMIPYTELYTIYTPLSYYLYGILYLFAEVPDMQFVMYYNCLFILISGFIFWKIIPRGPYHDTLALLYLLSISPLIFDVKIEALALPLLALLANESFRILKAPSYRESKVALYRSCILIAILFLFKQYYLVLLPMTSILFIISSGKQTRTLRDALQSQFSSIVLFCITIFILFIIILRFDFSHFDADLFLKQLTGKFILSDCASYSNGNNPLSALYSYFRYTLLLYPCLFGLWGFILFCKSKKHGLLWILFLLMPAVLFSFNVNPHYLFIVAPYLFILFTQIVLKHDLYSTYFNFTPIRINRLLIVFFICGSFYIIRNHIYADALYITNYKSIKQSYQNNESEFNHLQSLIGEHKKVYLGDGINKLNMYRLGLESINAKEIGYIFLYNSCLDSAYNRYATKDARLLNDAEIKDYTRD